MFSGPASGGKKDTPAYIHAHTVHVYCDVLWFTHEVLVLAMLGA